MGLDRREKFYAIRYPHPSSTTRSAAALDNTERNPPTVRIALLLYTGYLALFFGTWSVNGVDYNRIGESAQTTRLGYALPTLIGGAFLVISLWALGWWRRVLHGLWDSALFLNLVTGAQPSAALLV